MMRRVLTDRAAAAEGSWPGLGHILRFDWAEIAVATTVVYRAVLGA